MRQVYNIPTLTHIIQVIRSVECTIMTHLGTYLFNNKVLHQKVVKENNIYFSLLKVGGGSDKTFFNSILSKSSLHEVVCKLLQIHVSY